MFICLNFWDYPVSHGVIAHETYHATGYLMEWIGQTYDWESEAFPYLQGFIVDHIYKMIDQNGLPITPKYKIKLNDKTKEGNESPAVENSVRKHAK